MNALKKLSRNATFKTRLMVANATIMSTIVYMMPVWGGTEDYIIKAAQVIQNRAARLVTKLSWFTPQRILLNQTNWLSIRQLIAYHTILQIWRAKKNEAPKYIFNNINRKPNYRTRSVAAGVSEAEGYIHIPCTQKATTKKGIMMRGPTVWNTLPMELRTHQGSLQMFKKELKLWIKNNLEP